MLFARRKLKGWEHGAGRPTDKFVRRKREHIIRGVMRSFMGDIERLCRGVRGAGQFLRAGHFGAYQPPSPGVETQSGHLASAAQLLHATSEQP